MGIINNMVNKVKEAMNETTYTAPSAKAMKPKGIAGLVKKLKKISFRKMRLGRGIGMLNPSGNYLSPFDIHLQQLQGLNIKCLQDLLRGEIPAHSPEGADYGPHQLKDYKDNGKLIRKARYLAKVAASEAMTLKWHPAPAVEAVA